MATSKYNPHAPKFNPNNPATWLKPDEPLIGSDGRDWSWCYVWSKSIDCFPGYRIGIDGSVWTCAALGRGKNRSKRRRNSIGKWRMLIPQERAKHGHLSVCLTDFNGVSMNKLVHCLVLEAFIGPRPNGMESCHWDGNPKNNKLDNLRWDTPTGNRADQIRHGTLYGMGLFGEKHPTSKLTTEIVLQIMDLRSREGIGGRSIAKRLGLPPIMRGAVDCIIRGVAWNHLTGLPKHSKKTSSV